MSSSSDDEMTMTITPLTIISKREENGKKIFHYFCDDLSEEEIMNAKIILFSGKTGAGKTTAINAFVNIVKGIKLKDNKRYTMISEVEKEKGQAESQTEGLHLYYLKDYENNPVIIIDTQGFGDTGGKIKDDELNKTFEYAFSHIINHINNICLIVNSTDLRLGNESKYIYNAVTSLFAEDIINNFILFFTFISKDQIKQKNPEIIKTVLKSECAFLKDRKNDNKWYYMLDSKSIFDKDIKETLPRRSFKQLEEFYEKTVKESIPIDIKKTAEVMNNREQLIIETNNLKGTFIDIISKKKQLEADKQFISETKNKIDENKKKMEELLKDINDLSPDEQKKKIKEMEEQHDKEIKELSNQTKPHSVRVLVSDSNFNYVCNSCKKNCHIKCTCSWAYQSCRNFTWKGWRKGENECTFCHCKKKYHEKNKHIYEEKCEFVKVNNDENIRKKNEEFKINIEDLKKKLKNAESRDDEKKNNLDKTNNFTKEYEKDLEKKRTRTEKK